MTCSCNAWNRCSSAALPLAGPDTVRDVCARVVGRTTGRAAGRAAGRAGARGGTGFGGALVARGTVGFRVAAVVAIWDVVACPLVTAGPEGFRAIPDLPAAMFGAFFVDGLNGLFGWLGPAIAVSLRGGLLFSALSSSSPGAALRLRVVIIARDDEATGGVPSCSSGGGGGKERGLTFGMNDIKG